MSESSQASQERTQSPISGWAIVGVVVALLVLPSILLATSAADADAGTKVACILCYVLAVLLCPGFFIVNPNESRVLVLFGRYHGSVRENGFHWTNPFMIKQKVSLRAHNLNGEKLKVNDNAGNPIEIAAVVVWRVRETARAMFDVEDYHEYVHVQSESALRQLATRHPYDNTSGEGISLRDGMDEVAQELQTELEERCARAGVEIIEARISHLAYAPEIAGAMLRRQQADAVIAARHKIVDGAVGMVQMALEKLKAEDIIDLDDERKASMVTNLLVVLCSEAETHPVVNAGTLYN